jgi:hypothetical protein
VTRATRPLRLKSSDAGMKRFSHILSEIGVSSTADGRKEQQARTAAGPKRDLARPEPSPI